MRLVVGALIPATKIIPFFFAFAEPMAEGFLVSAGELKSREKENPVAVNERRSLGCSGLNCCLLRGDEKCVIEKGKFPRLVAEG